MANSQLLDILKQGVKVWNQWREDKRKDNPKDYTVLLGAKSLRTHLLLPDLMGANLQGAYLPEANFLFANLRGANLMEAYLRGAYLRGANLRGANLQGADLVQTKLYGANLQGADLQRTNLHGADLQGTDLQQANFQGANLLYANLIETNLIEANLQGANLSYSSLIKTVLDKADLSGCRIYGISAWDISLNETIQSDLIITEKGQPIITVDNLEVAQFIYLLLNNKKIRHIIDTITSKVVLILGRFTPERKAVLDVIRENLRKSDYLPVLFDFEKPDSRDFIETVSTLAHMAQFVIADFTDAKIVLEEVPHIIRNIKVPVIPLLLEGSGEEPVTLYNLRRGITYLLDTHWYKDTDDLLTSFQEKVIIPAEEKSRELRGIAIS